MNKGRLKPKWHTRRGLELGVARYHLPTRFIKDRLVLDVACGDGIGTAYLSAGGAAAVCGGDISMDSLRHARRLCGNGNHFTVLDVGALPYKDGVFDVVVSIETIEHIREQEQYLRECRRVLKEGGYFVCSTVDRDLFSPGRETPWFPGHVRELNTEEFIQLLSRYFDQVALYGLSSIETYGRFSRFIYRHEEMLVDLLLSFSLSRWLIQQVTERFWPRFRLINLERDNVDLSRFLNDECLPFLLDGSDEKTTFIIAAARKQN
jgi:ubiquinone/menaquinone biosynthesis C-methylase UbiE